MSTRTHVPTRRTLRVLLLSLVLALNAAVVAAPTAAAHSCTAEKGESGEADCSKPCKEGETHSHTVTHHHENGLAEDFEHTHYHCDSGSSDVRKCMTPRVLGMCPIEEPDLLT